MPKKVTLTPEPVRLTSSSLAGKGAPWYMLVLRRLLPWLA